ncbi:FkbM family methyltransferase [Castellaniella sp.]|uniref:FkbM family methyltransferase n=1 Tax=Castellaniella sp. TaxID=1955812 RepID=UPI002AFE53C7|nr:FkbM family methyltransferase [Castellaniella sp.]
MSTVTQRGNHLMEARKSYLSGEIYKYEYAEKTFNLHLSLFDYPAFIDGTDVEEVRLLASGVAVKSQSHQISMYIDSVDFHATGYTLLSFGGYEKRETDFMKSVFDDQGVFLDIGANRGWYSLVLSQAFPNSVIRAFEPIPSTFDALEKNISLNNFKNIKPFCVGMSNQPGEVEFLFAKDVAGATSMKLTGQSRGHADLERIICTTTTLDTFCADQQLTPSLIKIDVEGAELLVVQGGGNVLSHTPVLLIELLRKWSKEFGYHPNDVFEILAQYGYEAWVFSEDNEKLEPCPMVTEETIQTNFVFLHPTRHESVVKKWACYGT